jgi:hypothetical protein
MDSLGDGYQIETVVREVRVLRGLNGIVDIVAGYGVSDLLAADIGGGYVVEVSGQLVGYLTVSCSAVQGVFLLIDKGDDVIEEGRGAGRPVFGVLVRLGGEIVLHK